MGVQSDRPRELRGTANQHKAGRRNLGRTGACRRFGVVATMLTRLPGYHTCLATRGPFHLGLVDEEPGAGRAQVLPVTTQ